MFLISKGWFEILQPQLQSREYVNLCNFLEGEYAHKRIYPKPENVFNAINYVPLSKIKVVIIGQDPYHQPGQAHGLSFSVQDGVPLPPSLKNIFKEINAETGATIPTSGNLTRWAKQGVLLLNSVLTVEEGKPNSHKGKGWEIVTGAIIKNINTLKDPVVFLLWGANAKAFLPLINTNVHYVLTASHPSPMSANVGGWWENGCFKKTNEILSKQGKTPIEW